jgi:DNA-binding transcriptional regulator YiaG
MTDKSIPETIKELRTKMGLTHERFAAAVCVTFATVNRWEAGKAKPSRLALMRLEEVERSREKSPKGE